MLPIALLLAAASSFAQQAPQSAQPQMRVNVINVCTPSEADKNEIAAALGRIPANPTLGPDYETAHGRTTDKSGVSRWIRMRREFSGGSFSNVQYLLSAGSGGVDETLVFHARDSKMGEPLQIAFDHQVTAGDVAQVIATDTPPSRIRLERFGKPSLVVASCPNVDQQAYAALFRTATERFRSYRSLLRVRATVMAELPNLKKQNAGGKKRQGSQP